MPRLKKGLELDLTQAHELTTERIERLKCPADKQQVFLRDTKKPALRVRCTAAGAKSFVFETKLHRQTIRLTLGAVSKRSIDDARKEVDTLLSDYVNKGVNPIEHNREVIAAKKAKKAIDAANKAIDAIKAATVGEIWLEYITERRARRWSERHYADHVKLAKAGGAPANRGTRGKGRTIEGPLFRFMGLTLADLTPELVEQWAERERQTRPTQAQLALRILKAFINWCREHPTYRATAPNINPANNKRVIDALGAKKKAKRDVLLVEQLPAWFKAVRQVGNNTLAAYFQCLLIMGCRPGELRALKWSDINHQWRWVTIRDKVEGERVIPLTPYVAHLLDGLPKLNGWVFAADRGAQGVITSPNKRHTLACTVAGVEGLTLHGLRRSFASMGQRLDLPAGVVAQIQGHKPSATAEKHYIVRQLDDLRPYHERIEQWLLEKAEVQFDPATQKTGLRVVA